MLLLVWDEHFVSNISLYVGIQIRNHSVIHLRRSLLYGLPRLLRRFRRSVLRFLLVKFRFTAAAAAAIVTVDFTSPFLFPLFSYDISFLFLLV
ncbi:unnamed protein product [Cuscuta campestris]|uniref:Uncharacterized protein n=1 Tax=Cuscuta campestris TaxID=132261 RepID=A0A484LZC2_9ASTE|nr:unnamed protein product [Cuscuta campestris]